MFFLSGGGGTGKTYTYRLIYETLRLLGLDILCVCFTGIGALLLPHGCTAHYAFSLPLNVTESSSSFMDLGSNKAAILSRVSLIIVDEVSMLHKNHLKCINKLLQAIMKNKLPFGGKVILFGGDMRQLLPILEEQQGMAAVARHSVVNYEDWNQVQRYDLLQNQRAVDDPEFANFVIKVGNGKHNLIPGMTAETCEIPRRIVVESEIELIDRVFGGDDTFSPMRAVLSPTNKHCREINMKVLARLQGEQSVYFSEDTADYTGHDADAVYGIEELNSQTPSGLPDHELQVKVGCMLPATKAVRFHFK
jgi:hypothetical protein